jgi:hypothetical protein
MTDSLTSPLPLPAGRLNPSPEGLLKERGFYHLLRRWRQNERPGEKQKKPLVIERRSGLN